MTAEQIAVNAVSAARLAEIEPRGYMMARMYETLANIDTEGSDTDLQFAELVANAQAMPIVWGVEDADEPEEEAIAAAAGEAIAAEPKSDTYTWPDGYVKVGGTEEEIRPHFVSGFTVVDSPSKPSGWEVLKQKMGMR